MDVLPLRGIAKQREEEVPTTVALASMADKTIAMLQEKIAEVLVVGTHPSLNENKALVGDSLLHRRKFLPEHRTHVVGQPLETLNKLRDLVRTECKRFPVVLAAFESHHYSGQQLTDFFELLGKLSHGTVLLGEYAIAEQPAERMRAACSSSVERLMHQTYGGYVPWFNAHATFTPDSYVREVDTLEWRSSQSFAFEGYKVGAIVSREFSPDELAKIAII